MKRNLDTAAERLTTQVGEFLIAIAPCCSGAGLDETGIVNADGIFVELVGPIAQGEPEPRPSVCCADGQANNTAYFKYTVP